MDKALVVLGVASTIIALAMREHLSREPAVSWLPYIAALMALLVIWTIASGILKFRINKHLESINPGLSRMRMRFILDPNNPVSEKLRLESQLMENAGCFRFLAAFALFGCVLLLVGIYATSPPQLERVASTPSESRTIAVACLMALFPIFYFRYAVARALFDMPNSAYMSAMASGLFSVWLSWQAATASNSGASFNPFWGIIPAVLVEIEAGLQTKRNLIQDCSSRSGNRFQMPGGLVIILPRGLVACALASAACTAAVILLFSVQPVARVQGILHAPPVRWPLFVLGWVVPIRILALLSLGTDRNSSTA